jgi:hypothetical protein
MMIMLKGERVLLQSLRTLKSLRCVVKTKGPGSFIEERARAKAAVASMLKGSGE